MHFTDIFIRRPVFATVLSLIIVLIGIRAYFSLPVRQFPEIAASVINVSTAYPGAGSDLIEGFISTPIENALSGINGIDYIQSTSTTGSSTISVYFKLGYDINKAITDVGNAVSSVSYLLPQGIQNPVVQEQDPNAQPTLFIPFISNHLSPEQITDHLLRAVQPQIATLPGVSQAVIFGEREYAMRIWLNPEKMAALDVTAGDVTSALSNNNIQTAAGWIDNKWEEYDVTAKTDLTTAEQFNRLVIRNNAGKIVRLEDVGKAILGPESDRTSAIVNGKNAIILAVIPQSTANPLTISEEVRKVLPHIQSTLPPALKSVVLWDSSRFIAQSLQEVYRTILEATVFVIMVIFLFLGNFRSVLIPVVTIPLSIIGVFGVMSSLGYSLNILTLLALVLAIGLVVDDAIVVVENIHRHIEAGASPFEASIQGAREIGPAVIAMTLTLAAVYAPIGFVEGLTGALFREFAFTLAGAVIISGFGALTLSPMMCSKLMQAHHKSQKTALSEKIDFLFNRFMTAYQRLLTKALNKHSLIALLAIVIYVACYFLYVTLPSELAPEEDQGVVLAAINGPTNANLQYTEANTRKLEQIYKKLPEQIGYGFINGYAGSLQVNSAFSFLVLKPWEERQRSAQDIIATLFPSFWAVPGVKAFPFSPSSLPSTGGFTPVSFILKTTGSYQELNQATQKLLGLIHQKNPAFLNPDVDLKMDKAQVKIDLDRAKAADLGISMNDVNTTLNMALAQPTITRFNMSGRSYDVIPELAPEFMQTAQQLGQLNLRTMSNELVPLSNLASITQAVVPQALNHFQQLRSATISASLAPGYTLGEALKFLETISEKNLPKNIQYDFSGQSRQLIDATGAMQETFLFAILFILLVLAAQFESFRSPLIVMLSVPLSTAGALLTLHLLPSGTSNIYTQIGLVTLIGLITKHGILIVEFANQLQDKGKDKFSAIIEAASIRLRPIIMTTFATVLGALPLALSTGAGAGARHQLGWVIIGGMSFGTLFTLFIIPTAYLLLGTVRKTVSPKGL